MVFANARISEPSFRGYRWANRFFNQFMATVLRTPPSFLAQSSDDARRFLELGAPEDRVEVTGNLKYDLATPVISDFAVWLTEQLRSQERWPLVVAGSVAADEEEPVLAAYDIVQRQWRRALLMLAPRKPDRFDAASQIAAEDGWTVIRRSRLDFHSPLDESAEVMILDSIGELAGVYALADTVFVGGSLVPVGGHNILEPASHAKAPVFGSSMENFQEMSAQFLTAGAAIQVESGERLGATWAYLISHPAEREKMGRAALALVNANRRATERSLRAHFGDPRYTARRGLMLLRLPLWPFSLLYSAAARLRALAIAWEFAAQQQLNGTVISVGNLTVGGTGKTPMVIFIAHRLAAEGHHVAVLTRGYRGKRVTDPAPAGESQPPASTSDEVAVMQAHLGDPKSPLESAPTGSAEGRRLEQAGIDHFVLDDGFQHLQLARDVDVLLIDATNPFNGGFLLPAGRLREPYRPCAAPI